MWQLAEGHLLQKLKNAISSLHTFQEFPKHLWKRSLITLSWAVLLNIIIKHTPKTPRIPSIVSIVLHVKSWIYFQALWISFFSLSCLRLDVGPFGIHVFAPWYFRRYTVARAELRNPMAEPVVPASAGEAWPQGPQQYPGVVTSKYCQPSMIWLCLFSPGG